MSSDKIRVGVSSCLLGEEVRWNGAHSADFYIRDTLGNFFEWVSVCPEAEAGMGIPREPVRLVKKGGRLLMLGVATQKDWTSVMEKFSERRFEKLSREGLCGYVFKKKSPSCGLERVPYYSAAGVPSGKGAGLFAGGFTRRFPLVPAEEEGRLRDAAIRENFIVRVFSFHRLMKFFAGRWTRGGLVDFHTGQKYLLLSHNPGHYRKAGRLVAESSAWKPAALRDEYFRVFMEALKSMSTFRKNTNVLQHMAGFLRGSLVAAEKKDLQAAIADYHARIVPLIVPVTLIRHFASKYGTDYLLRQSYLNPHPKELMLRNHV